MNPYHLYCRAYQKVLYVAEFALPWHFPQITSGAGSVKKAAKILKQNKINNVIVVTDKGLSSLGLLDNMLKSLKDAGIRYCIFDGVQPNPTIYNIEDAREMYLANDCQGIIAFGGGSPMDCSKAMAARIVNPKKSVADMGGLLKVGKKIPTMIAIPTTAGTGSETTLAAVVSNPETHEKYPINDPHLLPAYAILDPELTTGLPKHITSTTGLDALTHAVEAYIGRSNTKETAEKALEATKLIFRYLKKAYDHGDDLMAREKMLLASHYAGIAFTRAYVGYVHAIAHTLGGFYGIPHGLANSVILPYVLDYYGESAYHRLADLADAADLQPEDQSDKGKALAFIAAIREMNQYMNIPDGFDQIKEEDIPTLVKRALHEGNPLYPVPKIMDAKDCEALIRKIMR